MKNKKGFTLIELVAVIVIIGVIALISTPIVLTVINSSREKAYEELVTNIEDAALNYSIYNSLGYNPLYRTLEVSKIQEAGYLEQQDYIDPRDNEPLEGCVIYRWDDSINQYDISYQDICSTTELNPDINLNIVNDNNLSWMNEYLKIEVSGEYDYFKYCYGENNCNPDIEYTNSTFIEKQGTDIYVCATGYVEYVAGNTVCTKAYDVDVIDPNLVISSIKTTSSSVTVNATCTDDLSLVKELSYSIDGGAYQTSNLFSNLKTGTHEVSIKCVDNALNETIINRKVISSIPIPTIAQISQIPSDVTVYPKYAFERVIGITYDGTDVDSPEYYFKSNVSASVASGVISGSCGTSTNPGECSSGDITTLVPNTWYKTNNLNVSIIFRENGYLYAQTRDSVDNTANASTFTVTNMDTTKPSVNITNITTKTDRATIVASCSDDISGITKYEFSMDNGLTWIDKGATSSHTFTGLTQGTNYIFVVRCTNGSGLTNTFSTGKDTSIITKPEIVQISQVPTDTKLYPIYATKRVIGITYFNTDIESPEYYFKSSVEATVSNGIVTGICGTLTNPSACSAGSVTTLEANTWYKTNSLNISVTYTQDGYLYAQTWDAADNSAVATTYTITNIDTTSPIVNIAGITVKTDSAKVEAICSDNYSGILKYEFSKDGGSTWVANGTSSVYTFNGLTQDTTYNFAVKCTNGSALTATDSEESVTSVIKNPVIAQVSQIPTDINTYPMYAQERVIRITYDPTNITSPKYYYSLDGSDWKQVSSTTYDIKFTSNGKVYAKTVDASGNTATASAYTVANMDTSAPSVSITKLNVSTDSIKVEASCSDNISGIIKYEFSKNGGTTWVDRGTKSNYTFSNLTQTTEYNIVVRCTNGSGMTNTFSSSSKTGTIQAPTIAQISQVPTDTKTYPTYATSRVIRVTYYSANIENPKYYYSYDGSTWNESTSLTKDLTFTSNGKVYAKTVDSSGNTATASTYTVANIDTTAPSCVLSVGSIKTDRVTLIANASDSESGITKYEFSKDGGTTWVNNGTTSSYTFTSLTSGTSYKFLVRCTNGSGLTASDTKTDKPLTPTAPVITQYSQTPSGTYAQQRIIRITYSSANIVTPTYEYSLDGSNWSTSSGTTKDVTFTNNGKLYARVKDSSGNTVNASTYTVSNIDTSAPSCSLSVGTIKTDRITLTATASDSESGVAKYEFSKDGGITWINNGTNSSYTYTGLTSGTSYKFSLRCTNGSGVTTSVTKTEKPLTPTAPTITQYSQTPSGTYAQSRVIRITYSGVNIVSPTYEYSLDGSTWSTSSSTTKDVTFTSNGKLYARVKDSSGNTATASTYTVSNIDTSSPNVSATAGTIKTDRITITASCSDSQSGITKYEFSKDNGSTYTNNGTTASYTFTGLSQGTSYKFVVRCTNGSGLTNTYSVTQKTETIKTPTYAITSNTPSSGYSYYTSRTATITYYATNIVSPEYYFKSSVIAYITGVDTSTTSPITATCGTGTNPGTCSSSNVTTLVAGTWYKTNSTTVNITYTSNGTIYAKTLDASDNKSSESSYSVTNIITSAPTITLSTASTTSNSIVVPYTITSSSGAKNVTCVYGTSTSYGSTGTISGNSCVMSGLKSGTTYYYKITVTGGNALTANATGNAKTNNITRASVSVTPTTTYATSRVATLTYSASGVSSPEYYFKSSVAATVPSGKVSYVCGNGTNPGTCSSSSVTTLSAGYWYRTNSTSVALTYTSNGTLYAQTWDASDNKSTELTYSVTGIDTSAPSASISSVSVTPTTATVNGSCSDSGSGITSTLYSKDGTNWQTSNVFSGLTHNTSYTFRIKCANGSSLTNTASKSTTTPKVTLSLSSTSGTIDVNSSVKITISGSNYGSLTCSSNSPSVATCGISGTTLTITGVAGGNATITVTEGIIGIVATYNVTVESGMSCSNGGTLTKDSSKGYICVAQNATASLCPNTKYECKEYDSNCTCGGTVQKGDYANYYQTYNAYGEWVDDDCQALLDEWEAEGKEGIEWETIDYVVWYPPDVEEGTCWIEYWWYDCDCDWDYTGYYCSNSDDSVKDDHHNGDDVDCSTSSYTCPSGWSYLSGSGTSTKCYQAVSNYYCTSGVLALDSNDNVICTKAANKEVASKSCSWERDGEDYCDDDDYSMDDDHDNGYDVDCWSSSSCSGGWECADYDSVCTYTYSYTCPSGWTSSGSGSSMTCFQNAIKK